jgi:hypothetical protein
MKKLLFSWLIAGMAFLTLNQAMACTNYLVTKGASTDGSTMITYAADSHVLYGELYHWPAGEHPEGTMMDIYEWDTGKYLGQIAQAARTYNVVGNMNEHQVAIGETTYGGRPELQDSTGIMDYGSLIIQPCKGQLRPARPSVLFMNLPVSMAITAQENPSALPIKMKFGLWS